MSLHFSAARPPGAIPTRSGAPRCFLAAPAGTQRFVGCGRRSCARPPAAPSCHGPLLPLGSGGGPFFPRCDCCVTIAAGGCGCARLIHFPGAGTGRWASSVQPRWQARAPRVEVEFEISIAGCVAQGACGQTYGAWLVARITSRAVGRCVLYLTVKVCITAGWPLLRRLGFKPPPAGCFFATAVHQLCISCALLHGCSRRPLRFGLGARPILHCVAVCSANPSHLHT